ncbi:MAG TPA: hypothetical protein VF746_06385 [Longimicrobium sp.]|jgi:hypothetical protein
MAPTVPATTSGTHSPRGASADAPIRYSSVLTNGSSAPTPQTANDVRQSRR